MNREELISLFDKYSEEVTLCAFDDVKNKYSKRSDLHAFILLDKIMPSTHDIICSARHQEIFLECKIEKLAKVITEEQIKELVACGVSYDYSRDCLYMFT